MKINIVHIIIMGTLLVSCGNKKVNVQDVFEDDQTRWGRYAEQIEQKKKSSATNTNLSRFERLMQNSNWIKHSDGFQYPDFFEQRQVFLDEIPADVEVYSYDSIELCYWPSLGVWSVADEFPSEGLYLSPTETVKNVTYRAESKGIASGYTNSGKIYYLKQKIMHGEGVDHSKFLVLISPPEYNKSVEKLTNMVAKW